MQGRGVSNTLTAREAPGGGALAVSLITFMLRSSIDAAAGFRITFIAFGLAFLLSIPVVFLMPEGKRAWDEAG